MDSMPGKFRLSFFCFLGVLTFASSNVGFGQAFYPEEFVAWARETLIPVTSEGIDAATTDLGPLKEMTGDARIVSLSHAVALAVEPRDFRNRLFKFLVGELGFTTIVVESGLIEGRVVNDYVLGVSGTLENALAQGLSWTTDRFPKNGELIRWMREYNSGSIRKLKFFGFDIPGSPGNARANRGPETGLEEALRYLERVDPSTARDFRDRLKPVESYLYFDPIGRFTPPEQAQYADLSLAERDLLTGSIADLVALLKRRRTMYALESGEDEYEWGLRAAVGARQMDDFLRRIPLGWSRLDDGDLWFEEALLGRDQAMAENMEWILARLDADERVLVVASVSHIAAQPIRRSGHDRIHVPLGAHLKRRHGDDVVTIGNLIHGGEIRDCFSGESRQLPTPPEPMLVNDTFASVSERPYVLDLRQAPARFARLLGTTQDVWQTTFVIALTMNVAFDMVYFSGQVTPSCV